MDNSAVKGWRGFKFIFGSGQQNSTDENDSTVQELEVMLEHHVEEIAFGGYRASHIEDE